MPNTNYESCLLQASNLAALSNECILFAHVNFTLSSGQALWVCGGNGVGKSTLILILAGILDPFDGEIQRPPARYIGHQNGLDERLSVEEILTLWCRLYQNHDAITHQAQDWLEEMGLGNEKKRLAYELSSGQKQRLTLLRLRLSPCPLWLLDEPETALDQQGKTILQEWVSAHLARGGMLVFTNHNHALAEDCQKLDLLMPGGA